MTEDEAKTKWCPFSRVEIFDASGGCSGGNRGGGITSCIGSACMAWRWIGIRADGTDYWSEDARRIAREGRAAPNREQPLGYCGLAGKP